MTANVGLDQDYYGALALGEDQAAATKNEELEDYITELKEALQDAEERLKDLEK